MQLNIDALQYSINCNIVCNSILNAIMNEYNAMNVMLFIE